MKMTTTAALIVTLMACSQAFGQDATDPAKAPQGADKAEAPMNPAKPAGDPPIPADTEVVTTSTGLKYSVLRKGTGTASPKIGDPVKVNYTGWRLDGKVFDASSRHGGPASFVCGQLIEGWNEALQMMRTGDKLKLTIPANLAYGERGAGADIPPNTPLIFEMELLDFWSFAKPDATKAKSTAAGLKYEVIREGDGTKAGPTDGVEMRFALWNAAGKMLTNSDQQRPLKGTRADFPLAVFGDVLEALSTGGRVRCECPPALAFAEKNNGPDLPPNSTTYWEFELVRIAKALPVPKFEMPAEEKLKTTASGLKYEVIKEGEGASPGRMDVVTCHYAGWLTDGTLFDSSYARAFPMSFQLAGVIPGWTEGLQLMKPGAVYRFVIPAKLAYGSQQKEKIPPDSTLVFQVELIQLGEELGKQ
jgi:FKBP-type peptidyl-prolyl cis-trans isomerase